MAWPTPRRTEFEEWESRATAAPCCSEPGDDSRSDFSWANTVRTTIGTTAGMAAAAARNTPVAASGRGTRRPARPFTAGPRMNATSHATTRNGRTPARRCSTSHAIQPISAAPIAAHATIPHSPTRRTRDPGGSTASMRPRTGRPKPADPVRWLTAQVSSGRGSRKPSEVDVARSKYPPIRDYGFIADCHAAALISREGSIDWCCLPRFDSGSCFGRLLDWDQAGFCSVKPQDPDYRKFRHYVEGTLVLQTTFRTGGGEVRLTDCFAMRRGGRDNPHRQILRVIEGTRGRVDMHVQVEPRFDYGEVRPWIRKRHLNLYTAIGGDDGLVISCTQSLDQVDGHGLEGRFPVKAGEKVYLSIQFGHPEAIDTVPPEPLNPDDLDRRLDETVKWWRRWSSRGRLDSSDGPAAIQSAMVLKGLTNAPTGAIIAAPTTSLPEALGGHRNWDYRFSWIRDSAFALRSLGELGFDAEADGFRRFVERSAAGNEEDLQIVFGPGGERRLVEIEIEELEGYHRSKPVRG